MIPDVRQTHRRQDKDPRRTVRVHFGAAADRLAKQLAPYRIDRANVRLLQENADALIKLYLCDLVTDRELRTMRQRLMKKIARYIDLAAEARAKKARATR